MTETLEVEYEGPWEEEIREYLRRVRADALTDESGEPPREVYARLVIELPDEAPLIEIERADDPLSAPRLETTDR